MNRNASSGDNELLARITTDAKIFGGKPIIRGHRLAVEHVLGMLAAGDAPESILKLVEAPLCRWPAVNFPLNVLSHFDLPDCRRAMGRRLVKDTLADPEIFGK